MDKILINKDNDKYPIVLDYDKTKYNIEYVKNKEQNVFVIKRLISNNILKVINDDIGFIVEYDDEVENDSHFFVSSYENGNYILSCYTDFYHVCDNLVLNDKIRVDSFYLDDFNISDYSDFMSMMLANDSIGIRYNMIKFGTSTSMMPDIIFKTSDLAENLDKLNNKNLKFLASELDIDGRNKMTIDELKENLKMTLNSPKTGSLDLDNLLSGSFPSLDFYRVWSVDEFVEEYQVKSKKKVRKN